MALPVLDFWTKVLPTPGKYASVAGIVAVLLSVMLAYREVRYDWPTLSLTYSDIRPSGKLAVILGAAMTLLYLATQEVTLGGWADFLRAVEYIALFVLLSFGFTRLAKKAYDFASKGSNVEKNDRSLIKFATGIFATLTTVVTGFAVLNELVAILPPIVHYATVSASLGVLITMMFIGADYTAEYLERNYEKGMEDIKRRTLSVFTGRNIVHAGILPTVFGVVCLLGFLALDSWIGGKPLDRIGVELLAISLKVGLFAFIGFGLWRFGVSEYEKLKGTTPNVAVRS
jgi:hypothetical protein